MYLLQTSEVLDGVNNLTEGKSEVFTLIVIGVVLIGFVMWRWEVRQDKEDARQERREEFQRKKDLADSEQLQIIGQNSVKMADVLEGIAQGIQEVTVRQNKHNIVLIHTVNALRSIKNGEPDPAHIENAESELNRDS